MEGCSMRKTLSLLLPLAVAVIVIVNTVTPFTTAVNTGTRQAVSSSLPPATIPLAEASGLTPHKPIEIIGNEGFTRENGVVAGSGTPDDPYIIEGWEIDASGNRYGIVIVNTTAYFIIRNCEIHGAILAGILLVNVTNGKIIGNTLANNILGIIIAYSSVDAHAIMPIIIAINNMITPMPIIVSTPPMKYRSPATPKNPTLVYAFIRSQDFFRYHVPIAINIDATTKARASSDDAYSMSVDVKGNSEIFTDIAGVTATSDADIIPATVSRIKNMR